MHLWGYIKKNNVKLIQIFQNKVLKHRQYTSKCFGSSEVMFWQYRSNEEWI